MKKWRKWTSEEVSFLTENYGKVTTQSIASALGRCWSSTYAKAVLLKLTKPKAPVQIGEKLGRLLVLKVSDKKSTSHALFFTCQCDCGSIVDVRAAQLRNGRTKSCGCYTVEQTQRALRMAPGQTSYRSLERRTKVSARKRNLEYNLTTEQFMSLVCLSCHWCGQEPAPYNVYMKHDGTFRPTNSVTIGWARQQTVFVNGIDRIDSSVGYTIENCVPCCSMCNLMKLDYSPEQFLNQVKKIAEHKGIV